MSTIPVKNFKNKTEFEKFVELKLQEIRITNRKVLDLKNIRIAGNPLDKEQFKHLISNLVKDNYPNLKTIDLRNNALTKEQLNYLLNYLKSNNGANITTVHLSTDLLKPEDKKLIQAIRNSVDQNLENQDRLYEEQRKAQLKSLGQSSPEFERRFEAILKEPRGKMEEPVKKEGVFARIFSVLRNAFASILPKKTVTKPTQTAAERPKTQTTAQRPLKTEPITTEPSKPEEPKPIAESFSPDKPLIFSQTNTDTEPLWKHRSTRGHESSYEPGFEVTTTETNPIETLQNKIDTLLRDRSIELINIQNIPVNVRETRYLATRTMATVHTQMNMLKEMKSILEKLETQSPDETQKALDSFKRKYADIPSIDQDRSNPVYVDLVKASQEFETEITKYINQITPTPNRPRI